MSIPFIGAGAAVGFVSVPLVGVAGAGVGPMSIPFIGAGAGVGFVSVPLVGVAGAGVGPMSIKSVGPSEELADSSAGFFRGELAGVGAWASSAMFDCDFSDTGGSAFIPDARSKNSTDSAPKQPLAASASPRLCCQLRPIRAS